MHSLWIFAQINVLQDLFEAEELTKDGVRTEETESVEETADPQDGVRPGRMGRNESTAVSSASAV